MRLNVKPILFCTLALMLCACDSNDSVGTDNTNPGDHSGSGTGNEDQNNTGTPSGPNVIKTPDTNCAAGEKLCNGVCVNITRSIVDCGACGNACNPGEWCENGVCTGCKDTQCGSQCVDLNTDPKNCGKCGNTCADNMACVNAECQCNDNYYDCDGDYTNGCEALDACTCVRGSTIECYYGKEENKNVGECKSGLSTCSESLGALAYGTCVGQILPKEITNICTDKDYNCNGIPDGQEDNDGDGYTICDGDLCDTSEMCNVSHPELINPGMLEIPENGIDDNCNGIVDEVEPVPTAPTIAYDHASSDLNTAAIALAQAMNITDICPTDGTRCTHGLVKATLTRASSTASIDKRQANVLDAFRDASGIAKILPVNYVNGDRAFAVLSTGNATDVKRNVNKDDYEYETIVSETTVGSETQRVSKDSKIPTAYTEAHGGKLQTHAACPTGTVTPAIFDSVQLHLELKVPANVKGIQFNFRFLTREYPKYVCSAFNDFFLALLTTKAPGMEKYPDKNIAFDRNGNPVSVNNGFFTTCSKIQCTTDTDCPAFMTCGTDNRCTAGEDTCRDGSDAISAYSPEPFNGINGVGGGTAWLTTTAPVVGGETISLDFYIWDTQDRRFDSTVLIDNFQWLLDETTVNTVITPEVVGPIY